MSIADPIRSQFADGTSGLDFDFTDLSTMRQNAAGTTAMTVPGSVGADPPIGYIKSKVNSITATQSTDAKRPILSGRYNRLIGTATLATQNVTTIAASYTLRFAGTGSIALSGTATGTLTAGTHAITCTAGTLTLTTAGSVTSADLRESSLPSTLPAYQAVVDANTYDAAGFPYRAVFNGATQFLKVETLDMSATDAVTVFAGVRKLSNAVIGTVTELSTDAGANNGTFLIFAPFNEVEYFFVNGGTNRPGCSIDSDTYKAPITNTITGIGDISSDICRLRVNGVQVAQSTTDQGTGKYGNYALYIGMRAGTSLPFNGEMTRLTIIGKLLETPTNQRIERIIANQMRSVI